MKKIITTLAFVALASVSAKAFELPSLGMFSVTAGVASNQGVFGATGLETNENKSGVETFINRESGVFTDSYSSQFVELGVGNWISVSLPCWAYQYC